MGGGTLNLSRETLIRTSSETGFDPSVAEKVAHLLGLLDSIREHPSLRGQLVLKGGTALNLFWLPTPRLSVDIDLNYIGAEEFAALGANRPTIESALRAVFSRAGFAVVAQPTEHAGGKYRLRYTSILGGMDSIEVDLNYMFRVPLWPPSVMDSRPLGSWKATGVHVLDVHELAAGKLAALLSRKQVRDLFDSREFLFSDLLTIDRLREAFVVYGAMNRKDWRTVSISDLTFDPIDLSRQLLPTLHGRIGLATAGPEEYGNDLLRDCRAALSKVLPLRDNELAFLDLLLDRGDIAPSLLTTDASLQDRIRRQPMLLWKVQNVRRQRGA